MRRLSLTVFLATLVLAACGGGDEDVPESAEPVTLGPVDGLDLPGVDLERVRVGDRAPDFSLVSLAGPVVTLSSFRGRRNVVLVFYRGWW